MSNKYVTNNDKNTTVIVANRSVGAGKTVAVSAKELEKWLDKGGHRLVDNGTLGVSDTNVVVSVAAASEKAEETPPPSNGDEGVTFDGKDPAEAVKDPEGSVGLQTPVDPAAGTPEETTKSDAAKAEEQVETETETGKGKKGKK